MWQLMLIVASAWVVHAEDLPPSCERPVYCDSKLLHHVQLARVFNDSKTFVDLEMKYNTNKTLTDFDKLLNDTDQNPSKEQLTAFVEEYFSSIGEIEEWVPTDFIENPPFLKAINDSKLRQFAKDINSIWPILSRKVAPAVFDEPEHFSLIPLKNGFIVPGGRFKEMYYWDTFWVIEGLLICDMRETAKGIIENLIELLILFGHIPNGSRWYYQERSQPPMLSDMMSIYFKYTNDLEFIRDNIQYLEMEVDYWLDKRSVSFEKDSQNYTMLRYYAPSAGPRPESYREDYLLSTNLSDSERARFYINVKSAAESGWDFSSRWFVSENGDNFGTLSDIGTEFLIPVDLNSIFAGILQTVANFHTLLVNGRKAARYSELAMQWRNSIQDVLWDEEAGVWYDYDTKHKVHRKYYYTSNLAPLWQEAVSQENVEKNGPKVVKYLEDSRGLQFPGGLPTSLIQSGEQWDFPNVWPPEVSIVVNALQAIKTEEAQNLAFKVAQTFVRSCLKGYSEYEQMFEKYDAEAPGQYGEGGEYTVQFGFGWTNGAVLEFLSKYGQVMTADDTNSSKN